MTGAEKILAAVDAVLDVFESYDSRDGIVEHMNYEEVDPIAYLAYARGRRALAGKIMLTWANNDPEAAEEHEDDLATWGLALGDGPGPEDAWHIATLNINPEERP